MDKLKRAIRDVVDFPKKGIVFKDITPLLQSAPLFRSAINEMVKRCKGRKIDAIAAIESRGFIFGAALAYKMGVSFVPVRKKGKLPFETVQVTYSLEYGQDSLEVHRDAFKEGDNVLIIDDLLATGGTLKAVCEMVEKLQARVEKILCVIELSFLKGREKLSRYDFESLIVFDKE
jgi:adenine phosphoribosyltransferase